MNEIITYLNITDIRKMVAEVLNIPLTRVIEWGKKQDVSNLKFFTSVRFNPSSQLSTHKKFNAVNEVQTIASQKETVAIVGFHGDNALLMAEFFQLALISEQASHLFDKMKVGLVRTSDVNNLTIPFGGGYEERAEIQLVLSHNFVIEHKQNKMNSVEIGLVLNQ